MALWVLKGSEIHGFGIFAGRGLKRGEVIAELAKDRVFPVAIAESVKVGDGYFFDALLFWMNHSCDPNVELDFSSWCVRARRDISTGEELTYEYGAGLERLACECGSQNCKGFFWTR